MLSEILGGGATSRLYARLVVEQGIAASAGSGYSGNSFDTSSFDFYASPRQGVELQAVEKALRAEIAALLRDGISDDELSAAKQRLRAGAVFARDALGTAPNVIGRSLAAGRSLEDIEAWPERIAAVTVERVNAAARAVLVDRNSVTGLLLPEPTS